MWAWAIVTLAALTLAPLMALQGDSDSDLDHARALALAERMSVLRRSAQAWARAHPEFNGSLDGVAVDAPAWWHGHPAVHALVDGRLIAVYVSGPDARGVLPKLQQLSRGSVWVGIADQASGTLMSPSAGSTGIGVPAAVPDKAPVWLALRD